MYMVGSVSASGLGGSALNYFLGNRFFIDYF